MSYNVNQKNYAWKILRQLAKLPVVRMKTVFLDDEDCTMKTVKTECWHCPASHRDEDGRVLDHEMWCMNLLIQQAREAKYLTQSYECMFRPHHIVAAWLLAIREAERRDSVHVVDGWEVPEKIEWIYSMGPKEWYAHLKSRR